MRKLYWRPHKVSKVELTFVVLCALLGLFAVEHLRIQEDQPYMHEKLEAAHLTKRGFEAVRSERIAHHFPIDPTVDPANSGMIGLQLSPVTSNTGHLPSKQTSVNPNFAALIVSYLKEAGVKEGDLIAIGTSGSFPGLNNAVLAAVKTLHLEPITISSASASQYGANLPGFVWLDMEKMLYERGIISKRSVAASIGGMKDVAGGLSTLGKQLLEEAIARNGVERIYPTDLHDSVERRMAIFEREAAGRPIAAYINVGGGAASVGTHVGKKLYKPGLNRVVPRGAGAVDSVMNRFAYKGVPIIHLTDMRVLAKQAGFPFAPEQMPQVGEGMIFMRMTYNRILAGAIGFLLILMLFAVIRTDWGYRLRRMFGGASHQKPPEPMV